MSVLKQILVFVLAAYVAFPFCCCSANASATPTEATPKACPHCPAGSNSPSENDDKAPSHHCPCAKKTPSITEVDRPLQHADTGVIVPALEFSTHSTQGFAKFRASTKTPDETRPPGVPIRYLHCVLRH